MSDCCTVLWGRELDVRRAVNRLRPVPRLEVQDLSWHAGMCLHVEHEICATQSALCAPEWWQRDGKKNRDLCSVGELKFIIVSINKTASVTMRTDVCQMFRPGLITLQVWCVFLHYTSESLVFIRVMFHLEAVKAYKTCQRFFRRLGIQNYACHYSVYPLF